LKALGAEAVLLGGWFCFPGVAFSAEQIKQDIPTGPKPTLVLQNRRGTISVKSWDQSQIEIQAEPSSKSMEVLIIPGEQRVSVESTSRDERGAPPDRRVDFEVWVPRQAIVRIESEHGPISVQNIAGDVSIQGVSNAIELANLSGHIMVRTVDGPIVLRSCEGHIQVRSISGELKFIRVNATELQASTNSGMISYEGDFGSGGQYALNNFKSPINITASDKASFDLTARAVEGFIESDIPFQPAPQGHAFRRLSPNKFLRGRFRSGESSVQITSYSGTIRLHGLP